MIPFLLACFLLTASEASPLPSFDLQDFDLLMGKKTEHWKYIALPEDQKTLAKFKALYERNLPLQFGEHPSLKIPKIVHFIWLGPRAFPPESVENLRTWMAHHPDWTFKFWTDRDRPAPCIGMEVHHVKDFRFIRLASQYEDSRNWGEKSDLLRYEILFQEGGIYADHDANCLRSFAPLNGAYDFYSCLETPHPPFAGFTITTGMGVLGSRAQHPILARVMDLIANRWDAIGQAFRGQDAASKVDLVMNRTYIALTDAIKAGINEEGNTDIVLPAAYFFAKHGLPSVYSKHFYATAWAKGPGSLPQMEKHSLKQLRELSKKNQQLQWINMGLAFLSSIALLSFAFFKRKRPIHDPS